MASAVFKDHSAWRFRKLGQSAIEIEKEREIRASCKSGRGTMDAICEMLVTHAPPVRNMQAAA